MNITPEIQAHFDEIFNRRFAEVKAKIEARTPVPEAVTELERLLSEAYNKLRITELKATAASLGAISAEQVAALLDGTVKVDDAGKLYVVNCQSERRFMPDGKSMPVEGLVSEFLELNPHLVKASVTTGAGSKKPDSFWGIF